jgi:hypothetical protein
MHQAVVLQVVLSAELPTPFEAQLGWFEATQRKASTENQLVILSVWVTNSWFLGRSRSHQHRSNARYLHLLGLVSAAYKWGSTIR